MLDGHACLSSGATVLTSLNDDRGEPIPGHRGVAHEEGESLRRRIGPELGEHQATFTDLRLEGAVPCRIDLLNARADHRNGASIDVERGSVRGRVDAGREPEITVSPSRATAVAMDAAI